MESLDLFSTATSAPVMAPAAAPSPIAAARLRALADAMQNEIDNCYRDRQTNTPKRQREAASARLDGKHLERTQEALRLLADLHEAGNVPHVLAGVKTKKAAHDLTRTVIEHNGGYYDAGTDTGKPSMKTPEAVALWERLQPESATRQKAEELRRKVDSLMFSNIPGYFPTPAPVIARMLALAGLRDDSEGALLEPEAGSGHILDFVRGACPRVALTCYERHYTLQEILRLKGYAPGDDFLEAAPATGYNFVLMNPPFERGQDMQHVRHAYECLAPGGVLVAVMAPAFETNGTSKAAGFRAWLEEVGGGIVERLAPGTFKESGTGVSAVLIRVRK